VLPIRRYEDVAAWLSVTMGMGAIQRLLYGDGEFVGLCSHGSGITSDASGHAVLGLGQGPKDCNLRIMGNVLPGS